MALRKHLYQLFVRPKDIETRVNRMNIIAFILLPVLVCWGLAAYVMFFSE